MTSFYIDGGWVELDELETSWRKLEVIKTQCELSAHSPVRGRAHLARKILRMIDGSEFTTNHDKEESE